MGFRRVIEQIETERMAVVESRFAEQFFRLCDAFVDWPARVLRRLKFHAADVRLTDHPCRALSLP
ncbi:hypothetical protein D3C72_1300100 [compost metagenome]